jgi:hypothetical protein
VSAQETNSPILSEAEAIAWLKLDGPHGPKDPSATLKFYRSKGLLRGARIGRSLKYPRWELEAFVRRLVERGEMEE